MIWIAFFSRFCKHHANRRGKSLIVDNWDFTISRRKKLTTKSWGKMHTSMNSPHNVSKIKELIIVYNGLSFYEGEKLS